MSHRIIQEFTDLNEQEFEKIAHHYGYAIAACYQMTNKEMVLKIATDAPGKQSWPAVTKLNFDYTPKDSKVLPHGWIKPIFKEKHRNLWPKGVNFYLPIHNEGMPRLVFAIRNKEGKRTRFGDLNGILEALASRITSMISKTDLTDVYHENNFQEEMRLINTDISSLLDHELRTPMSSIVGYASLLADGMAEDHEVEEFRRIILDEAASCLKSIQRLSGAFGRKRNQDELNIKRLSLGELVDSAIESIKAMAPSLIGIDHSEKLKIAIRKQSDANLSVLAAPGLLKSAFMEVLSNGICHAEHHHIEVTLYQSENSLVVDVKDDGPGVPPEVEGLIFLRFFQITKGIHYEKGNHGFGLGLFLARQTMEQHGGKLLYVRVSQKGGLFRFILPMAQDDELLAPAPLDAVS